jgi:hypothetical protein
MKIFSGQHRGVSLNQYIDNNLRLGNDTVVVHESARRLPDCVDNFLLAASLCRKADGTLMLIGEGSEGVARACGATLLKADALVIVDVHLMNYEPFSIAPADGTARALIANSWTHVASAPYSAAAAIYTRFHGMLLMEPGSSMELKERYKRFPPLDWWDRLRGRLTGTTRFIVRHRISYDGQKVTVEKLPEEKIITAN